MIFSFRFRKPVPERHMHPTPPPPLPREHQLQVLKQCAADDSVMAGPAGVVVKLAEQLLLTTEVHSSNPAILKEQLFI